MQIPNLEEVPHGIANDAHQNGIIAITFIRLTIQWMLVFIKAKRRTKIPLNNLLQLSSTRTFLSGIAAQGGHGFKYVRKIGMAGKPLATQGLEWRIGFGKQPLFGEKGAATHGLAMIKRNGRAKRKKSVNPTPEQCFPIRSRSRPRMENDRPAFL